VGGNAASVLTVPKKTRAPRLHALGAARISGQNRGHRRRARVGRGNPAGRTVDGTSGQGDGIYGRPPVPSSMVVSVTAKPTGWTRHSHARRRSSRGTGPSTRCGKPSSQPTRSSRLPSRSLPPTHVRRPRSESRKPGARNGVGCPADDPSGCSPTLTVCSATGKLAGRNVQRDRDLTRRHWTAHTGRRHPSPPPYGRRRSRRRHRHRDPRRAKATGGRGLACRRPTLV
jgi:hypothetical protein